MKISNTPNPMLTNGLNSNQAIPRKSVPNENIIDTATRQERKDMYVPKSPVEVAGSDSAIYNQNAQFTNNFYQGKELNYKNLAPGVDLSKINGIVSELYERKPTEEENRLLNLSMKLDGKVVGGIMKEMIWLESELGMIGSRKTLEELYSIYDKRNGTDSSDKIDYYNAMGKQARKVNKMLDVLGKACNAGKTRDDIMDFVTDNSFSKADFDYVMNVADHFDYENNKLTDKNATNTNSKNVSSDLQSVMKDLFS